MFYGIIATFFKKLHSGISYFDNIIIVLSKQQFSEHYSRYNRGEAEFKLKTKIENKMVRKGRAAVTLSPLAVHFILLQIDTAQHIPID